MFNRICNLGVGQGPELFVQIHEHFKGRMYKIESNHVFFETSNKYELNDEIFLDSFGLLGFLEDFR